MLASQGRCSHVWLEKRINISMISTSEIKISVVIDQKKPRKRRKALHNEFKLERK